MPILLTAEDVDDVFDDPAFMEERFSDVQGLLLGQEPAPGHEVRYPLPPSPCLLTVRPHLPGPLGGCVAVRVDSVPTQSASSTARAELLVASDDGSLLGITDAGALDGWRAAIPAGLAARYLAPPSPRFLGLLGAGEQSWSCLLALHHALPSLEQVHVVGRDPVRARAFAAAAARRTGLVVRAADDARATARGADIVAVTGSHPPIAADWLAAGALLVDQTMAPTRPAPAARSISLVSAEDGGSTGTPPGLLPLVEIITGRSLPRCAVRDVVHYRGGELKGWSTMAAAAGLGQAWRKSVGTPMRLGRKGR